MRYRAHVNSPPLKNNAALSALWLRERGSACLPHPLRTQLVRKLRMHLAWRWFTGLGFDSGDSASLHFFQEPARTARETERAISKLALGEGKLFARAISG
jgi:hypothetical protein